MSIDENFETKLALEPIKTRLRNIENKQIWTYKSVRTINGEGPDDLGNVNVTQHGTDPLSLHLDQTIPQSVINGYPTFEGIKIKSGFKLILDA